MVFWMNISIMQATFVAGLHENNQSKCVDLNGDAYERIIRVMPFVRMKKCSKTSIRN